MSEQQTPYSQLGGEVGVRELVDRFYDYMDSDATVKTVRELHAKSLRVSREKLFLFLSGWLGGPDLYVEKYGHPRLRARHLPFSIGMAERDQWMHCMHKALADMSLEPGVRDKLGQAFAATADHMRNRAEYEEGAGLKIYPGSAPAKE